MGLSSQITLLQYSTRFWTYRPPQGWVFDDLTDGERNRLRESGVHSIKRHGILTKDGTIRLPTEVPIYFGYDDIEYLSLSRWFARCILTDLPPFALARFQLARAESSQHKNFREFSFDSRGYLILDPVVMPTSKFIYLLDKNSYFSWLWDDEVAFYQSLGSCVTLSGGYGWDSFSPPTTEPLRTLPMYSYIYALVDPFTEEVRYVGKSDHPEDRFLDHLKERQNAEKRAWVEQLQARGATPKLLRLEQVEEHLALELEHWWVQFYEKQGHKLTNFESQYRLWKKSGNKTPF